MAGPAAIAKNCRSCGITLTILQRVRGLCDQPECRRKDIPYQEQLRRKATLQRIREKLQHAWDQNAPIALLPSNTRPLVALPSERIEAHLQYLSRIIVQAREGKDVEQTAETQASTHGISPLLSDLPALPVACGICGGHCCSTGGDTAWLEAATIRRLGWHAVGVSDERIVNYYLSFLPDSSYQDSCIYHTEKGCNLPRTIRSNVCNQYLCRGLADLATGLSIRPASCVAASVAGTAIYKIAIMDAMGVVTEQIHPAPATH
jgi:hypothetical protein